MQTQKKFLWINKLLVYLSKVFINFFVIYPSAYQDILDFNYFAFISFLRGKTISY